MKKNFLITTGGSGGHVVPATILYQHLSKVSNVIISTDKRGLKYLEKGIYQFEIIDTPKINNILFLPFNLIIILFLTIKSLLMIKRRNINQIISTGGYMSLPIVLAARLLKLKIYLVEPNQVLGRANRYFLNSCKKIFCYNQKVQNFPENFQNKIIIINPLIREDFYKIKVLEKIKNKFTLLIVGGSQGADIFDKNLKEKILNIAKIIPMKIIQQTSKKNISFLNEFYSKNNIENKIFSFDKNFVNSIQDVDLCITRAGASTLAEFSILNIPFVAVPLPTSKYNHQLEKANFSKPTCSTLV